MYNMTYHFEVTFLDTRASRMSKNTYKKKSEAKYWKIYLQ
jgi:hypothetical protein